MVTIALPGDLLEMLDGPEPTQRNVDAAEKEHMGDFEKQTGIYHPDNQVPLKTVSLFDLTDNTPAPWQEAAEAKDENIETIETAIGPVDVVTEIVSAVVPEMETDAGATIIPIGDAMTEATDVDNVASDINGDTPTAPPPVVVSPKFTQWELEKRSLEEQIAELSVGIAKHKARAKALGKELDDTIEQYEEHISNEPSGISSQITATIKDCEPANDSPSVNVVSSSNASPAAAQQSPIADPNAWRSVPTTALDFDSIKGMGKKKIESLLERCPTLGEFEDLRATFGGLTNIKGIGGVLASDLENAMMDWLAKNRDNNVLSFAGASAQKQVEQTKMDDEKRQSLEAAGFKVYDDVADALGMNDGERKELDARVEAKREELRKMQSQPGDAIQQRFDDLASGTDSNRYDPKSDLDVWKAGAASYANGAHFRSCPLAAGPRQDDWLRGWLAEQEAETGNGDGDDEDQGDEDEFLGDEHYQDDDADSDDNE
jgi:hypothetical protein